MAKAKWGRVFEVVRGNVFKVNVLQYARDLSIVYVKLGKRGMGWLEATKKSPENRNQGFAYILVFGLNGHFSHWMRENDGTSVLCQQ
jgi:hypothetical protein